MIGTGDDPPVTGAAPDVTISYEIRQPTMATVPSGPRLVTFTVPGHHWLAQACIQYQLDKLRAESLAADDPPSMGPIAENDGGAKVA